MVDAMFPNKPRALFIGAARHPVKTKVKRSEGANFMADN